MNKQMTVKLAGILLLIGGLAAAYFLTPLQNLLNVDTVIEITDGVPKTWWTAATFLLLFFAGGALLFPIPLMALAVSLVFPTWIAVLIVLPGFALAASGGYLVGLIFDRKWFGESITRHIHNLKLKIQNKDLYAVFALRIAPTPPFTVTSMISGILRIHYLKYLVGSVLGIMPLGLSAVFFGRGAIEMLKDPSGMALTTVIAALVLITLFLLIRRNTQAS